MKLFHNLFFSSFFAMLFSEFFTGSVDDDDGITGWDGNPSQETQTETEEHLRRQLEERNPWRHHRHEPSRGKLFTPVTCYFANAAFTPSCKAVPQESCKAIFCKMEWDVAISWQLRSQRGNKGLYVPVTGSCGILLSWCRFIYCIRGYFRELRESVLAKICTSLYDYL